MLAVVVGVGLEQKNTFSAHLHLLSSDFHPSDLPSAAFLLSEALSSVVNSILAGQSVYFVQRSACQVSAKTFSLYFSLSSIYCKPLN